VVADGDRLATLALALAFVAVGLFAVLVWLSR